MRGWLPLVLAFFPVGAGAMPVRTAETSAADLGCMFAEDCSVAADTSAGGFRLGTTSGDALLETRVLATGDEGTVGAGLRAFLYRLNLSEARGLTTQPCVTRLSFESGPIARLDYDADGTSDGAFVLSLDGTGSVGPGAVEYLGDTLVVHFAKGVCAGDSSYEFGFASWGTSREVIATVRDSTGTSHQVAVVAADIRVSAVWWKNWQLWLVLAVVTITGFLMMRRR